MHRTHTKSELHNFLSEYPLYKPYKISSFVRKGEGYADPAYLNEEIFGHFCMNEMKHTKFKLNIPKPQSAFWNRTIEEEINELVLTPDKKIDYTLHYKGTCTSCNSYSIDFLLHIWSDAPIPENYDNVLVFDAQKNKHILKESTQEGIGIYIEKVGKHPQIETNPDARILQYLYKANTTLYRKALEAIQYNLGYAAFTYLKQVVDSEMVYFILDISELAPSNGKEIKELLRAYKQTKNPSGILEAILPFLPKSLQIIGENPLKAIYKLSQTEIEFHSDEEMIENAESIHSLLKFIINMIFEEKTELISLRNKFNDEAIGDRNNQ